MCRHLERVCSKKSYRIYEIEVPLNKALRRSNRRGSYKKRFLRSRNSVGMVKLSERIEKTIEELY